MENTVIEQLKFRIDGRIPSKKNSKRPFVRNGRMMIFSSKQFVEWHKEAMKQIKYNYAPIEKTLSVELSFFLPDNRKTDLTNKAESIMDLLVDCGVLQDDNCNVVPNLTLKFLGVSKVPCCLITIETI